MTKALVIGGLVVLYFYIGHNLRNHVGTFWAYFGIPVGLLFWFAQG